MVNTVKDKRRSKTRKSAAALAAAVFLAAMLPLPSRAADQTVFVDFDDGTAMGFDVRGTEAERARGTGVLTVVTEEAHSGEHSLLITDRQQNWNGPALDVTPYIVPGAACEISVWVKLKTPESAACTLSTQIDEDGSSDYPNLKSNTISSSEWTEMTATYTYGIADRITVYVECSTTEAEFYIDDFSFTVIDPEEPFEAWDPYTDPLTKDKRGVFEGFDYEFWSDKPNEGSMMLTGGGTYTCEWDGFNLLFRTGKRLGSEKTYKEYGSVIVDYAAEHNIERGAVSYLCVYGWTEDPMIEFYVVDNYGSYKPPGGDGFIGEIEVDGGVYEVYTDTRVEMPSIQGPQTFEQIFSVRVDTDKRTEGVITLSDHFKAWEKLGYDLSGNMYEVSLCVEGFSSKGNANVYKHVLTIGDDVYGADGTEPAGTEEPTDTEEPEATEAVTPTEPVTPTGAPAEDDSGLPVWLIVVLIAAGVVVVGAVIFMATRKKKT